MPKLTNARTRQRIDLTQDDFKFQGGEGAVYFQGGVVYKVCDPGKMIPIEKIKELAILDHPQIIRPAEHADCLDLLFCQQVCLASLPAIHPETIDNKWLFTKLAWADSGDIQLPTQIA